MQFSDTVFPKKVAKFVKSDTNVELTEQVVNIARVAKVITGGRRFAFNAIVVVGDHNGHVGYALGKAPEVPDAIRKAIEKAKNRMVYVPRVGTTIPHDVIGSFGAARVLLKPASEGTGVIAGGAIRAVLELAGVKDILTKSLRSNNPHNTVKAVFDAIEQFRTIEMVAARRGVSSDKLDYLRKEV